jgi:N-acetylglucosamine kinase-like BadF-type ATPase
MLPVARAARFVPPPPPFPTMFVLGIDAGGTKTVCLLADGDGRVRASARGPGANLQSLGELEVEKVLHEVMESALAGEPARPSAICLGIAGVDRPHDNAIITGIMRRIGHKAPVLVVNDALIALVAGAGEDRPGIVLIAGTGSICYGRDAAGRAARAGGWGYLLGDEGSGWWIGREALSAVLRAADGRGPATLLTGRVLQHFGFGQTSELIYEVYHRDTRRRAVAGLAVVVQRAVDDGDVVARQILAAGADELAQAVHSVASRLEMRGLQFPLVLSGSLFRVLPTLLSDVLVRLAEVVPRSQPKLLDVEPAVGAVRLALAETRGDARVPQYV